MTERTRQQEREGSEPTAGPMERMADCPKELDLERFVAGRTTPSETAAIETHRAECSTCSVWISEARADEALLPRLRAVEADSEPGASRDDGGGDAEPALARYTILRRIGAGGMGVVYEAEQQNPRRPVALKVLRPAVVSERTLQRFADEARLLARLDHPGIARIFEAGTYVSGDEPRPFFALELVDGRSLTGHADAAGLDVRARVALIVRICGAVQHAHQKGIVHRDLKPKNVLVTPEGHPKILDFGVAQTIEDGEPLDAAERGEIVGTPAYMSPEQLAGDTESIDTRTDVYALGACLYELLCGRPPVDVRGRSLAEVRERVVAEPPSLDAVGDDVPADLAAITAKALARDPEERYPSAAALADDLTRFSNDEQVAARRPGTLERARRHWRRNRAWISGVVLAFVTLVAGIAATWSQARRARAAEAAALAEAATVEQVNAFLQRLLGFDADDPLGTERDEDATFGEILAEAEAMLDREPLSDAETEARFRVAIGNAWRRFGRPERAVLNLSRALAMREELFGPRDRLVAESSNTLGVSLTDQRKFDEALACFERALSIYAELGDPAVAPLVATTRSNVAGVLMELGRYAEADEHLEAAIALHREHLGADSMHLANDLCFLGVSQARQQRFADAVLSLRSALETARRGGHADHPYADDAANRLILALSERGRWDDAEPLARELAASRASAHGERSPEVGEASRLLAGVLLGQDRPTGALEHAERAVSILSTAVEERATAERSGDLSIEPSLELHEALVVLGRAHVRAGDPASAESVLTRASHLAGVGDIPRGRARALLGSLYTDAGRYGEAQVELDAAIAALAAVPGFEIQRVRARFDRSRVRVQRGEWRAAAEELLRIVDELEGHASARAESLARAVRCRLGQLLLRLERFDDALAWLAPGLDETTRAQGADAPASLAVRVDLAASLLGLGRADEAIAHLEAVVAAADVEPAAGLRAACELERLRGGDALSLHRRCEELDGAGRLPLGDGLVRVATRLAQAGFDAEAARWLERGRDAVLSPPRDPRAAVALAEWVEAAATRGRYDEAQDVLLETLHLFGEDGLRDATAPMQRLLEAGIALYEAQGRSGWADELRARRTGGSSDG